MTLALTQLAMLWLLAAVVVGTGQLIACAVRLRRLQHLDASSAAVSALLGVAVWTVGFSLLSGVARLPARLALGVLVGMHLLVLAWTWRRRAVCAPRVRGPAIDWLPLGGAVVVTSTLALLPVLTEGAFNAANDTHTYCALAEWLQEHGFGEAVSWTVRGPADRIAALYQSRGFPLGATYPLALTRATGVATTALALYPPVSALGLVLSVCGVWWMTRRTLRLGRPVAAVITLAFGLVPHAAYWAHHNGFLSQTFAVPGLLLGLGALGSPRGLAGRTEFLAFSLAAAFLYVIYLPFLPLLVAAAVARAATDLSHARREGRVRRALTSWAMALLFAFALVGLDLTPLLRGLPVLLGTTTAGTHIPLGLVGFAAVALGLGPGAGAGQPRWLDPGTGILTLGAALLTAIGIRALWGNRRGHGVLAVTGVLAALVVRYGFLAQDPWTGDRGHSWLTFKAVQWAFPILLLLQASALRRLRRHRRGIMTLFLIAAVSLAPAHLPWSEELGRRLNGIVDGDRPLEKLGQLIQQFRGLPRGRLVLLGLPERVSLFRADYAALFSWPRPIFTVSQTDRDPLETPGAGPVVPLLADAPPFDREGRKSLGGGFALLTTIDRPRLVQIVARQPAVGWPDDGATVFALARSRTKLVILSPRNGPVEILLDLEPPAGAETGLVRCRIVQGVAGGTEFRRALRRLSSRTLHVVRGSKTLVRFEARRGFNAVVLNALGAPQRLKDVTLSTPPAREDTLR